MPDSLGSLDVHCPFSIFHSLTFWCCFVGGDNGDVSVFVAHELTFVAHELTFVFVSHELTLVANWTSPRSD